MNPLLDSEFLIKLNNDRNRTIYAHVISLNQYEHPIEQLEGVVTAGSITIDGQSAVRRVCSLTLSAKNLNINNVYWGLSTKVKIEIGLQNNILGYEHYGDVIWFKQGVFILTDFKTTQTLNNYTINLTGKDKMCLLNGDVSGNFPAPVRFDSYTDSNKQWYQIGSERQSLFGANAYDSFLDTQPAQEILSGFQERYGSDYQYIRGAQKILTLQYLPSGGTISSNAKIKFSQVDTKWTSISSIATKSTIKDDSGNYPYDINLNDQSINGFLVQGCNNNDKFMWTIEQKIPISIIIQEMLHQFGQERYSNIIIKDIEPYALEMLDNGFDKQLYLLHNGDIYTNLVTKETLKNEYKLYLSSNDEGDNEITDDFLNSKNFIFRNYFEEDDFNFIDILSGSTLVNMVKTTTQIVKGNDLSSIYTVLPVGANEVAGYGMTLLVYPDDLICQPGDSITSILDKIVNMLGNYEYFYNLDGQFVFQAKPAYLKTAWNGTIYLNNENYVEASELANKVAYTFDDAVLTTQYQNTPNINNIKNDFIIWGERKNFSGNTIKFHGRYAIENPPLEYTDFNGITWTSDKKNSILKALKKKMTEVGGGWTRKYNYPLGLDPNWWEVNDWADFYMSVFGIDLSINSTMMQHYSQEKGIIKSAADGTLDSNFQLAFGYGNNVVLGNSTDIVVIVYTDPSKTQISQVVGHGQCVHYYSQFMDLRKLGKGWDYGSNIGWGGSVNIYNSITGEPYRLENGQAVTTAYHPDLCDAFIYKPILPDDVSSLASETLLSVVYPDAKNINGHKREYAFEEDVDWRHLIHIMADDWYQHHTEDDYEINLRQNNCWPDLDIDLFPYGRTGYEQYYLDFTSIGGFWQDLYDIYKVLLAYYNGHKELTTITADMTEKEKLYIQKNIDKKTLATNIMTNRTDEEKDQYFDKGAYKYWNKDVVENPEKLTFWFDFFKADEMGIGKFATTVIGDRPKTINDSTIKTIIYRDTPDVVYCSWTEYLSYKKSFVLKDGYKYIIVDTDGNGYLADTLEQEFSEEEINTLPSSIKQNFVRSIRGKSVHDQADDMLYQYSYYNDTVNISNVPIYYLQPNTIISIKDELSRIIGYYIMDKINISLAYNGMMQITAVKSPERIY